MKQLTLVLTVMFLVLFVCFSSLINALEVEYYGIEARASKNMSLETSVTFLVDCEQKSFEYQPFSSISSFDYNIKNGFGECVTEEKLIKCRYLCEENKTSINMEIKFASLQSIKKTNESRYELLISQPRNYDIQRMFVILYLPETATLVSDIPAESFSPNDGSTLTDGKHIMVYWERENVTQSEAINFSINYNLPSTPRDPVQDIAVITLTIVIVMIMIGIGIYMRRPKDDRVKLIMPVLKQDEKTIIDILTKYNGETFQRTLVRESDFSKARVSRLVASLKERGVLDIEPLGRTNKIKLKMKV
jgi:uncharacterized membrane protein